MSYCADLPADSTIRRILIVKWSAMGDLIIATALFEDIVRAFPDREIHLDTQPAWQPLFAHDRRFQKVLTVDWRDRRRRLHQMGTWLRQVWAGNYDLAIDLQCNDRSRLLLSLLWLGGRRIRYRLGNRRQFPYNIAPTEPPPPVHAFIRGRAALQAGGIPTTTPRPVLHIPARTRARVRELLERHGLQANRRAGLPPSSGGAGAHRVDRRSGRTRRVSDYRPAMRLMAGRSVRANRNS